MNSAAPTAWTENEDNSLRSAIRHHGVRRWDLVALLIPNRSEASCCDRWAELLNSWGPQTRRPWTEDEDGVLMTHVARQGATHWSMTASFLPGRNAKQCRERWHNQLNPAIKHGAWSTEEDVLLLTLQRRLGNAWSRIAAHFPGRTDNAIKNRWNSAQLRRHKRAGGWHSEQFYDSVSVPARSQKLPEVAFNDTNMEEDWELWDDLAECLLD